jgi:hypothetical protein
MKKNKTTATLLLLLVMSPIAASVCNCVGCQSTTLPVGSQSWCRCCLNVVSGVCGADNCTDSVFTYNGCVAAAFEDRCLDTSAPTPVPTLQTPTTPSPTPFPPTPAPSMVTLRTCNCVGCSSIGIIEQTSWCRCCAQTFKSACTEDATCQRSVFRQDGCIAQNYTGICL